MMNRCFACLLVCVFVPLLSPAFADLAIEGASSEPRTAVVQTRSPQHLVRKTLWEVRPAPTQLLGSCARAAMGDRCLADGAFAGNGDCR